MGYTLEQLIQKKKDAEVMSDLPIEDFIDWEGWIFMIDSHISSIKGGSSND